MKAIFSLALALLAAAPASAELLRPEAVNGAVLGGIAGAVIGNNSGDLRHNAWKGAAIGAGVGLIAGEMIGNARVAAHDREIGAPRSRPVYSPEPYVYRPASPIIHASYSRGGWHGHDYYRHRPYRDTWYPRHIHRHHYYRPSYSWHRDPWYHHRPGLSLNYYGGYGAGYPYYGSGFGSSAANGLFLGALAGGIIGHNSGEFRHDAWRGAAWGAGAGWLLGTIADANRRERAYDTPVVVQPATVEAQPAAAPQQVTIINNYYNAPANPMSGANSLFGR